MGRVLAVRGILGELVEISIRAPKVLPSIPSGRISLQRSNELDARLSKLLDGPLDISHEEATHDGMRRKMWVGSLWAKDLYPVVAWELKRHEI